LAAFPPAVRVVFGRAKGADSFCAEHDPRPISGAESTVGSDMADYEIFEAGDTVLQSGATLRGAKLAYKTFGRLNATKDNAIVYPTW
jgi:hypothetical protein